MKKLMNIGHWWNDTDREQEGAGILVTKLSPPPTGCGATWQTGVNAWAEWKYGLISDFLREAEDACALLLHSAQW
jgi:hypothetical protein